MLDKSISLVYFKTLSSTFKSSIMLEKYEINNNFCESSSIYTKKNRHLERDTDGSRVKDV